MLRDFLYLQIPKKLCYNEGMDITEINHETNYKINFSNLHLIKPCKKYMVSFREALLEFMAHGVEDFSYPKIDNKRDERAYLRRCERFRKGKKIPQNFVPSSTFWLVDGTHFLGIGNVRHALNDNLRRFGGHIGYAVRPAAWRKGLGTLQLALLLAEAQKLNIPNPIITCFDGNIGSIKIIEKNGGVLINKINNKIKDKDRLTRIYQVK